MMTEIKVEFEHLTDDWKLTNPTQCNNCPWRKDSKLDSIIGYSREQHENLVSTIWDKKLPTHKNLDRLNEGTRCLRMMSCHESTEDKPYVCIGWLYNQIGDGNNIPLRVHALSCKNILEHKIVGEQYSKFEYTIPFFQ